MSAPEAFSRVQVVRWGRESQLLAQDDVEAGETLVAEFPVAFVETADGEDEDGPWLLLEGIASSSDWYAKVTALDLKLTKWPLAPVDEATLAHLAKRYKRNQKKLTQLYFRVAANNIRYQNAAARGFGIWPTISRSNHACNPSAELRGLKDRPLVELLIANRALRKGEPVTWNYMSETAFLELGWKQRNAQLFRDFQFLCRCSRCEQERPSGLDAMTRPELIDYFARA